MNTTVRLFVEIGRIRSQVRSRHLNEGIYEFKSHKGDRMLYFYSSDGRVIVTHGFKKTTNKITAREIQRAKSVRDRWEDS